MRFGKEIIYFPIAFLISRIGKLLQFSSKVQIQFFSDDDPNVSRRNKCSNAKYSNFVPAAAQESGAARDFLELSKSNTSNELVPIPERESQQSGRKKQKYTR